MISEEYIQRLYDWVIEQKAKGYSNETLAAEMSKLSGISISRGMIVHWLSKKLKLPVSENGIKALAAYRGELPEATQAWLEGKEIEVKPVEIVQIIEELRSRYPNLNYGDLVKSLLRTSPKLVAIAAQEVAQHLTATTGQTPLLEKGLLAVESSLLSKTEKDCMSDYTEFCYQFRRLLVEHGGDLEELAELMNIDCDRLRQFLTGNLEETISTGEALLMVPVFQQYGLIPAIPEDIEYEEKSRQYVLQLCTHSAYNPRTTKLINECQRPTPKGSGLPAIS